MASAPLVDGAPFLFTPTQWLGRTTDTATNVLKNGRSEWKLMETDHDGSWTDLQVGKGLMETDHDL